VRDLATGKTSIRAHLHVGQRLTQALHLITSFCGSRQWGDDSLLAEVPVEDNPAVLLAHAARWGAEIEHTSCTMAALESGDTLVGYHHGFAKDGMGGVSFTLWLWRSGLEGPVCIAYMAACCGDNNEDNMCTSLLLLLREVLSQAACASSQWT
jgi:hypothetical protein